MREREIAKITQGFELNTQADGGTFHRNREDWYRETRGPKTTTSVLNLLSVICHGTAKGKGWQAFVSTGLEFRCDGIF